MVAAETERLEVQLSVAFASSGARRPGSSAPEALIRLAVERAHAIVTSEAKTCDEAAAVLFPPFSQVPL